MARGKTDVRYFGGILDGEIHLQINTRFMYEKISIRHESFYAIDSKGNQKLLKDESKEGLWDHRLVDVYNKIETNKPGISYQFDHTEILFRCNAINKNGNRCKHECGLSRVCSTHNRANSFETFKHAFNFVELKKITL